MNEQIRELLNLIRVTCNAVHSGQVERAHTRQSTQHAFDHGEIQMRGNQGNVNFKSIRIGRARAKQLACSSRSRTMTMVQKRDDMRDQRRGKKAQEST